MSLYIKRAGRNTRPARSNGQPLPMRNPASPPPSTASDNPSESLPPRPRADSHVRVRPSATGFGAIARGQLGPTRREQQSRVPSCIEDIAREHHALAEALRRFDLGAMDLPRDPSVHAAAESMAQRLADLGELRSALGAVYLDATDPRMQEILQSDSPLSEYLRGVYSWCRGVLRAFDELAIGLRTLQPDWALFRSRLDDARAFYLEEIEGQIQL